MREAALDPIFARVFLKGAASLIIVLNTTRSGLAAGNSGRVIDVSAWMDGWM